MSKIQRIPANLVDDYVHRRITSFDLAELTGMNASYLRRAIKREPPQPKVVKSQELVKARNEFRNSIAHLPATEIATRAHVSVRTAQRLKAKAVKLVAEQIPPEGAGNNGTS